MQVVNGHMKRCSTLLIIREMQTRTSVNYELMLVRVAIVKKNLQKTNAGENLEKREPSYTFFFLPILLMRMQISAFTMEDSLEVPYRVAISIL